MALRRKGVLDPKGEVALDGVLGSSRVDDPRSEIGELYRLFRSDVPDHPGFSDQLGVSRVDAVHVGPKDHLGGTQGCSQQGRREVGSASTERGGRPAGFATDEALKHGHLTLFPEGEDAAGGQPSDGLEVRNGRAEVRICPNDLS